MRHRLFPTGSLVAAAVTVGCLAVLLGSGLSHLMDPAPMTVSLLLMVPAGWPMVLLLAAGARNPIAQATWWRLTAAGYTVGWTGALLRTLDLPPAWHPDVVGPLLGATGLLGVLCGIVALESARGIDEMPDVLIDAVLLAGAFGLLIWCSVVRPTLALGLTPSRGFDFATCAIASLLTALLSAAYFSGPIKANSAGWSSGGMAAYALSFVVILHGNGHDVPVLARVLWALCGAYTAVPLIHPAGASRESEMLPWSPAATAVACTVPVALYVAEAVSPPEGTVPDAVPIGATLALLCLGCVARVARSVKRVEEQSVLLEDMARSDHLTGLPNRRTADEELRRAFARAALRDEPVAVALCDLDHFKAFNDRYGHHAGDELLIGSAKAWSAAVGDRQVIARYGGEEFLVISTGLAASGLSEVIDRMRRATPRGQSFSAGIAAWDGQEDAGALVARADGALYEAKENGRARTCIAYSRTSAEALA